MVVFPNAKINLGLQIIRKREDGFHDLNSVFYPVYKLRDVLEILPSEKLSISISGIEIDGNTDNNLCIKAYKLLASKYKLPPISIYLHKNIPLGAGLGGGSSDATFTLIALNKLFNLQITNKQLCVYAAELGSDCPFFVNNTPAFAQGRGERLSEIEVNLKYWYILMVKPDIHISTTEAFSKINIAPEHVDIKNAATQDPELWKNLLVNNFEDSIFPQYPVLKDIKKALYSLGASYASMTGSGATIFGLFKTEPVVPASLKEYFCYVCQL